MRITYRLTLDMLLPVPTQAVLFETRNPNLARHEYNRALRRLGGALSVSNLHGYPTAVLAGDRTLAVTPYLQP